MRVTGGIEHHSHRIDEIHGAVAAYSRRGAHRRRQHHRAGGLQRQRQEIGVLFDIVRSLGTLLPSRRRPVMRERFGLNAPVIEPLSAYLNRLLRLDLGTSARFGVPISELIAQRLPGTLLLMALALGMAAVMGVALGAVMSSIAGRPDGWWTACGDESELVRGITPGHPRLSVIGSHVDTVSFCCSCWGSCVSTT